jgi:hypothetical protein
VTTRIPHCYMLSNNVAGRFVVNPIVAPNNILHLS